ncbi:MAG: hypothetical protein IJ880_00240 [Bacilli bacterium]|nr:hypothetical protein [Bacilli bacterium]
MEKEQILEKPSVLICGYGIVGKHIKNIFYWADTYDIKFNNEIPNKIYDFAFVCVPTPMKEDGSANIDFVRDVIDKIRANLFIIKSTIPPNTTEQLKKEFNKRIVFSPEYQGNTQHTLNKENFIIVGGDKEDTNEVIQLYQYVYDGSLKTYQTTSLLAEITKYMENSFLATKVIFCNEFYRICKTFGVNYTELRELFVADPRVNKSHTFVYEKYPYFDSKCFNKDIPALIASCKENGYNAEFLKMIMKINEKFKTEDY